MGRLRVGETLRDTFRVVLRNLPAFLATQGVLTLAAALLAAVVMLTLGVGASMLAAEGEAALALAVTGVEVFGLLLAFGVYAAGLAVGVHVADGALRGERVRMRDAWGLARPRALNLAGTALLLLLLVLAVTLALLLGMAATGPPSEPAAALAVSVGIAVVLLGTCLLLFALWGPALPVAALEERPVLANYGEASQLTKGARWPLAGAALLLALAYLAALAATGAPVLLLQGASFTSLPSTFTLLTVVVLVSYALWTVLALLFTFLWTALTVVAYRRLAPAPDTGFEVLPDDEPSFVL